MSIRMSWMAWVVGSALLLGACIPGGPGFPYPDSSSSSPQRVNGLPATAIPGPYAQANPNPVLPQQAVVSVWGSPETAPYGTMRTLHVSVYTNQYYASQNGGGTGVSKVNLAADGDQPIGSVNVDPNLPYAQATIQWMPPTVPSEVDVHYTIDATGSGFAPGQGQICVTYPGVIIDSIETDPNIPGDGSCDVIPLATGSVVPSILSADAHVDHADCSGVGIVFNIHVHDPSARLMFAYIELENAQLSGGGHSAGKVWTGGVGDVYSFYEEWFPPDLAGQFPGADISLTWTAKIAALLPLAGGALNQYLPSKPKLADDVTILSDGPHQLQLSLPTCEGQLGNHPVILRPNIQPYLQPAATPTLVGTCPPGTYYAPVTNKCIAIQIVPTKKPSEDDSGGSCPAGKTYSCTSTGMSVSCGCK